MTERANDPASRRHAKVEIQVQFYDVDALHVVWHGHYAKFFERARCALMDGIAYSYAEMRDSGFAWPVIDLHVRYAQPAVLGQRIIVRAEMVEWEQRLRIEYVITDAVSGARLSKGSTTQVAVNIATGEMCFASPPILLEKLGLTPV
jgi:acyl-CoA thioester hydrolase